jgi:hypothetical protein
VNALRKCLNLPAWLVPRQTLISRTFASVPPRQGDQRRFPRRYRGLLAQPRASAIVRSAIDRLPSDPMHRQHSEETWWLFAEKFNRELKEGLIRAYAPAFAAGPTAGGAVA